MAESHVQLKREEVVGDEVVLTDISPSTNTESVVDLSTGLTLDEDLLRLWNAINNKLYRVVNSVNGRTGVVVLSAKDVGLDNVDNVSFADIQEWVLEQIEKLFGSHSFKLYESMDSVLIDISANDKMMYDWILNNGYEPIIIATKLDKLKRSQVQKNIKAIKEGLKLSKDGIIIPFSAETKQGRDEIWALIDELTGLAATEEA